jgi:hypothetical protein
MPPSPYHHPAHSIAASDLAELVVVARCPCCRTPLIARMGRDGPYFYCQCVDKTRIIRKNLTRLQRQQGISSLVPQAVSE